MRRVFALAVLSLVMSAAPARSESIRLLGTGVIDLVYNAPWVADVSSVTVGMPWELEFSFETTSPGTPLCGSGVTNVYDNAVSDVRFTMGTDTYFHPGGSVFLNAGLPAIGCGGSDGLVQFHWFDEGLWTSVAGKDWINSPGGIMILSYNDVNALAGNLPHLPEFADYQDRFTGFKFGLHSGFKSAEIDLRPIPEPGSVLLLAGGLAGLVMRRRRARRHPGESDRSRAFSH